MKKIKILCILPYLTQTNGVLSFYWSYLEYYNSDLFDIEIVSTDNSCSESFLNFCEKTGITVHLLPSPKKESVFKYLKSIKVFMKNNHDYDIVHCNVMNYGYFFLKLAKKYGIKTRILHSHSTSWSAVKWKYFLDSIIVKFTKKYTTHFVAGSEKSGAFAFKNKVYTVIPYGVNSFKFSFSKEKRSTIRKLYNIPDDAVVIGDVARLAYHKNPEKALMIFYNYHIENKNSFIVFVGSGELTSKIRSMSVELGIEKNVILTGPVSNTNEFYSSFDIMILPSRSEGFGMVAIEGQYCKRPCVLSYAVPKEAQFNTNVIFIDIDSTDKEWVDAMNKAMKMACEEIPGKNVFDAKIIAEKMDKYYLDILRDQQQ